MTILGNSGDGVLLASADGSAIYSATIFNNAADGVTSSNSSHVTISGSSIAGNSGDGLRFVGGSDAQVLTDTITGNAGDGLAGSGTSAVLVSSSTIASNSLGGALFLDGSNVQALGDTISGNAGDGFAAIGASLVAVSSSTIAYNGGAGVRFSGGLVFEVLGGAIEGNRGDGVVLASLSGASVLGVSLIAPTAGDASVSGVTLDDVSQSTIGGASGNTISGFGIDGISLDNSPFVAIEANTISMSGRAGIALTASNDAFVSANEVTAGGVGILITGSLDAIIAADVVAYNAGIGVEIISSIGVDIDFGSKLVANSIGLMIDSGSSATEVASTFIGTMDGATAQGNVSGGILIEGRDNTIGGFGAGAIITSNGGYGILMLGASATGNLVEGSIIGVPTGGSSLLGNAGVGVAIMGATNNTLGGPVSRQANIIAGNANGGVLITGSTGGGAVAAADDNYLFNNTIGTTDAPNLVFGVSISGTAQAPITGLILNGDQITGNVGPGLVIEHGVGNQIIGTIATFNQGDGIDLNDGARNTVANSAVVGNSLNGLSVNRESFDSISGLAASVNGQAGALLAAVAHTEVTTSFLVGNSGDGLDLISSQDSGLDTTVVVSNKGIGVLASDGVDNVLLGNVIGVAFDGATPAGNLGDGVFLATETGDAVNNNVISANGTLNSPTTVGVQVVFGSANVLVGNRIGTDLLGNPAPGGDANPLGNRGDGVSITYSPNNTVHGNVISGNFGFGVALNGSDSTAIIGNNIGTDANGSVQAMTLSGVTGSPNGLANFLSGIHVESSTGTTIGGTDASSRNVISGNGRSDLYDGSTHPIAGQTFAPVPTNGSSTPYAQQQIPFFNGVEIFSSAGSLVEGNLIGLEGSGAVVLTAKGAPISGNGDDGIYLVHATDTTIGGGTPAARNVISGNGSVGIELAAATIRTAIQGNYVGTDVVAFNATTEPGATQDFGNGDDGVVVGDSSGNTIGGSLSGQGNVISGNGTNGVASNTGHTTTGGASGNNGVGVYIFGQKDFSSGFNLVQGNRIGTDYTGEAAVDNSFVGVLVTDSVANTIGGSANLASGVLGQGNQISGNLAAGVLIYGYQNPNAGSNLVAGNLIGTDATGMQRLKINVPANQPPPDPQNPNGPQGLQVIGVLVQSASNNTIGGRVAGSGNLISGNLFEGVGIVQVNTATDLPATNNLVAGNLIGTDVRGQGQLFSLDTANLTPPDVVGNGRDGVFIGNSSGNTIGGTSRADPADNVISGNGQNGIHIDGKSSMGNQVLINTVGVGTGGVNLRNENYGILISGNASNNPVKPGSDIRFNRLGSQRNITQEVKRETYLNRLFHAVPKTKKAQTKAVQAKAHPVAVGRSEFATVLNRPMKAPRRAE